MKRTVNVDRDVAAGFGDEWSRFDQSQLSGAELQAIFDDYFNLFPRTALRSDAAGADFGCGSGRWAACVAPRVGRLYCIDASPAALEVAKCNLAQFSNCEFLACSIDESPLPQQSLDFAYSLGVLHHVPDTQAGIRSCVAKLKKGAPFLLYLYYRFDNRSAWYAAVWRCSDIVRRAVSHLPFTLRYWMSQLIAASVYWPLARFGKLLERAGIQARHLPLHYYRDKPFYVMRTDALDRFGTRLEQRFTRNEIARMMTNAGLANIAFSEREPFWCAVGYKQ